MTSLISVALVESSTANHYIRNVTAHQNFFYRSALCVCAIEDQTFFEIFAARLNAFQLFDNIIGFINFIGCLVELRLAALSPIATQYFVYAFAIVLDDAICHIQNIACGPVVLF